MIPVLDSLIGIIMNKLVDAGIKKIVGILEVESDMEALQRNMNKIRRVLLDAESKKIESKSINLWLAELREVAYDAEDLLDDFAAAKLGKSESVKDTTLSIPELSRGKNNSTTSESVKYTTLCIPSCFRGKNKSRTSESVKDTTLSTPELSRDKNNSSTSKSGKDTILSFPGFLKGIPMKNEISNRIKNINSNLSKIYSDTKNLQLLARLPDAEKKVSRFISSRIIGKFSFQIDYEIVGIDDDATDLVERITGDSHRAPSLFAITGMGGIGKTTLARKVFNHHLIQNHFHNNIVWVCVSRNPSGEELLKEIVESIEKKDYSENCVSLNTLFSKLIQVVKEKRVFIVLDDIWDICFWKNFLRVPLLKVENYSRILITTRNQEVVNEIECVRHMHAMKHMLQSDGWSMLCKIVFKQEDKGDMDDMNELADVGKKIVGRCQGLPLAIEVVGGLLRMTDRTRLAWARVLSSTTWSNPDLPENILPSLLLSYEDLPLYLKQCFTYCSLFPEDYEFSRFNLENLWIAEGFIKKVKGKDVEYSARDYYDELVMRNFLQEIPWNTVYFPRDIHQEFPSNFLSKVCKMHDLLHSLAVFLSQNQYIHNSGLTRRHHLSFIKNDTKDEVVSQEIKEEYHVRTLLLSKNSRLTMVSSELLSSLRRLRVLDLEGTGIKTLPDSLGALIHLRFLNVSHTELRELPDSIKNLKNLETLEATNSNQLRSLPMGISELFNLRCLRVELDKMPNGLDNLKNLRILDRFVVNDCTSSIGRQYTPNMKELKDLSQLTNLFIDNLERVASKEEAEEAAIEMKTSLEILTLCCEIPSLSDENIKKIEEVFAGIKLPQNLTKFCIHGFFGKQLPDHMISDHLRQVTSLELSTCKLLRGLPFLGDMPNLQKLQILYAESVVKLGFEFLGSLKFPKLQGLFLHGMLKLERMFEVEKGAFPCLVELTMSACPKLNSLGEGLNHVTSLKMLTVQYLHNLKTIENLSSISQLIIRGIQTLSSVKKLPSLKIMKIESCRALEDVNEIGELNYLYIENEAIETLPRWLKSITPPKKLFVEGSKELVRRTHQSVEDQNILKKCLYAEVRTVDGPEYISYMKDHSSYYSNLTGSSGASSSSVTITEQVNTFMGEE